MSNEDISQNPEKLRALTLERGARIERLEVALSHARHALILWTDDPHGDLRDSAIEFADKALDDDGAGGGDKSTESPNPTRPDGGRFHTTPPQHREALEALDVLVGAAKDETGWLWPDVAEHEAGKVRHALEQQTSAVNEQGCGLPEVDDPLEGSDDLKEAYRAACVRLRELGEKSVPLFRPYRVPEAFRKLPDELRSDARKIRDLPRGSYRGGEADAHECIAITLERALAQHSELENGRET